MFEVKKDKEDKDTLYVCEKELDMDTHWIIAIDLCEAKDDKKKERARELAQYCADVLNEGD